MKLQTLATTKDHCNADHTLQISDTKLAAFIVRRANFASVYHTANMLDNQTTTMRVMTTRKEKLQKQRQQML